MDYTKGMNKIINDIMSNNNSAVMLFAPSGSGKTDFLSELSNRYQKVFWFNALTDNVEAFVQCLAEKVFVNEPNILFKVKQMQYCDPDISGEYILTISLLDYISTLKSNCLLVLERMEMLPRQFDKSLIECLIKHSPKNLKIVVSSDSFIDFEYNNFEPVYPVLIDENSFENKYNRADFDTYIADLSEEELCFLSYLAELTYFEKSFISEFYPHGVDILLKLSQNEGYAIFREDYFRYITSFKEWLLCLNDRKTFPDYGFNSISAVQRAASYLDRKGKFYEEFKLFDKFNDLEGMDFSVKKVIFDKTHRTMVYRYCAYYPTQKTDSVDVLNKYPYYGIYVTLDKYINKQYIEAARCGRILSDLFAKSGDLTAYWAANTLIVKSLCSAAQYQEAYEFVEKIKHAGENDIDVFESIFYFIPTIYQELNLTLDFKVIRNYEIELQRDESKNRIWYGKVLEAIALAYLDAGKHNKAMELINEIKKVIPFYVIHAEMIMLYYFSGDVVGTQRMAEEALNYAMQNGVKSEISTIYAILGNINQYYGKNKEALEFFDKAVSSPEKKFYVIAMRCMAYAKAGEVNYAVEVAHIYLKYCETFAPYYKNRMMSALAYCYYKQNNKQQANFYATRAIKESHSRSIYWIWSMGIAIEYLMSRGDLKDAPNLIGNFLKTCANYNMGMAMLETPEVFEPIFVYAEQTGICSEFVATVRKQQEKKNSEKKFSHSIRVKLFGLTSVYVGEEEVQWKTKKAKELFLHYVLAGKDGIDRGIIIDYLWKDYVYESAINNLKTTNNIIRKTLAALNIKFELQYINCKYILILDGVVNDYGEFTNMLTAYKKEINFTSRLQLMSGLLERCKEEFAIEMHAADFNRIRQNIVHEMSGLLLRLVKELMEKRMYVDAKKFLSMLSLIEKKDEYKTLMDEISKNIK